MASVALSAYFVFISIVFLCNELTALRVMPLDAVLPVLEGRIDQVRERSGTAKKNGRVIYLTTLRLLDVKKARRWVEVYRCDDGSFPFAEGQMFSGVFYRGRLVGMKIDGRTCTDSAPIRREAVRNRLAAPDNIKNALMAITIAVAGLSGAAVWGLREHRRWQTEMKAIKV